MARVIYAARALADLQRLQDFLAETDPQSARRTLPLILSAAETLIAP